MYLQKLSGSGRLKTTKTAYYKNKTFPQHKYLYFISITIS